MRKRKHSSGQALVVVITLLALLLVVGLAFFMLSQAERSASVRHLDSVRARYIAEAGVTYAQQILKLDRRTNLIDSLDDITVRGVSGTDIDLDGDGTPESRWFSVADSAGGSQGRFAIKITDEASKINLNSCPPAMLAQLFSVLGVDAAKAGALTGARPFNAVEQIGPLLGKQDFSLVKNFLTVYSRDIEVDLARKRRVYLNGASAQSILQGLLSAGINDSYQKAANIKDASDGDVAQTVLDKFVLAHMAPSGLPEQGGWRMNAGFYEAQPKSEAGRFTWSNLPIEDGEYFCFLYGPSPTDVVGYVNGEYINSGDGLLQEVKVTNGGFSLEIKPAQDIVCRFSSIDLEGTAYKQGLTRKVVRGTEALVINELMVAPAQEILGSAVSIGSGESIVQTLSGIRPSDYYVTVLARNSGGLVGDVTIHGTTGADMHDGDYLPSTVNVESSGELTVQIKNNSVTTATFKGIKLSQQPDGEWIEVLNISPQAIDMSGFSFEAYSPEGELAPGWPARVAEGVSIGSYQQLAFAVDANDGEPAPSHLCGNRISFQKIWGFSNAGLVFSEFSDVIDKTFDLLPDRGGRVVLKDAFGREVDAVEYQNMQVNSFVSLERADPAATIDSDGDGFFDGWYNSANKKGATPGLPNDNIGMYTFDEADGKQVQHTSAEVVVFNRALSGLAEADKLSAGERWKKFALIDLAKMEDHFAYEALAFDLSGNYLTGDFEENNGIFECTRAGQTGVWEFSDIAAGNYTLAIFSDNLSADGQKIEVTYKINPAEEFNEPVSILFSQGVGLYGMVDIPGEDGSATLQLKIVSDSPSPLRLKSIRLEPIYAVDGRINVNTAKLQVLHSIFNADNLVQAIINNRPLGVNEKTRLGVGQLFLLDAAYLPFHNLLTVKSDIYEINSLGESYRQGRTQAYQVIRTVFRRGD
jgi:type II secretory pathway component PulK